MKHTLLTIAVVLLIGCNKNEIAESKKENVTKTNLLINSSNINLPATNSLSHEPTIENEDSPKVIIDRENKIFTTSSNPFQKDDYALISDFETNEYKNRDRHVPIKREVARVRKTGKSVINTVGYFVYLKNGICVIRSEKTENAEGFIMPAEELERKENDDAELRFLKKRSRVYDKNKNLVGYLYHQRKWFRVKQPKLTAAQKIGAYSSVRPISPWDVENYMTNLNDEKVMTLSMGATITYNGNFPWLIKAQAK